MRRRVDRSIATSAAASQSLQRQRRVQRSVATSIDSSQSFGAGTQSNGNQSEVRAGVAESVTRSRYSATSCGGFFLGFAAWRI